MPRLSVYIIAYNEADKIEAALRSVTWADEVVVADSNSIDATVEIARRYTDRVIQVPFAGFGKLRNDVLDSLSGDWILSLDADERCTEAAAHEIRHLIESPDACDAYLVPRRNYFFGRWIRHSAGTPTTASRSFFAAASCATPTMPCTRPTYWTARSAAPPSRSHRSRFATSPS